MGIQLIESGIQVPKSGIQYQESGIHCVVRDIEKTAATETTGRADPRIFRGSGLTI